MDRSIRSASSLRCHMQASSPFSQVSYSPLRSLRFSCLCMQKVPQNIVLVRPVASSYVSKDFTYLSKAPIHHAIALGISSPLQRGIWNLRCAVASTTASLSEGVGEGLLDLGFLHICRKDLKIGLAAAVTVLFAVANKVLYKMALIPLKEYPFFLALINTFGYVTVYFSILYMRYQSGLVTKEMLGLPKLPFVLAGALEALGLAAGMAAAANLPGASISILLQTLLVWQLVLSKIFLKRSFSCGQIAACGLVVAGVAIALSGGQVSGVPVATDKVDLFGALLMITSCAFQASSTIVKEFIFRNASKCLECGSVDIFVVNSHGSAFQSFFVLLMLPFLSQLRGVPFSQLSSYMASGAGCLFNIGSPSAECSGATLLTLSYVVMNLAFNISVLSLLKMSSAVVSSLCSTLAVPLTIYIFTLPLPYVGVTASLHPQFVIGVMILFCGLALYNFFAHRKSQKFE
ncbi:hypothetical protein KP509_22G006400 [Ceratopteris richardii]|uniref:Uncharacterized protein n=1 Tax=Ceratopteris richardii TaxID=49495 RepID=A0A8T2S525_CERRI|nr:hypothetical protein KP509_22G006400 [Ceratopteris richardii]